MSMTALFAGRLAGPLVKALLGPQAKKVLLGPPEQRAAEKIVTAAARRLAEQFPDDLSTGTYLVRMLSTGAVAQLLVDSAFPDGPPLQPETLRPLLIEAGYDPETSAHDVVEQAMILGRYIAEGLRTEVDQPGSPLHAQWVNAYLDTISASRQAGPVQADKIDSLVPGLPTPFIGRDEDLARLRLLLDPARPTRRDGRQPPVVIQGWPGVGKSSFAAAVARDPAVDGWFPDGILWATLSERPGDPPDVRGQLDLWLRRLRVEISPDDKSLETRRDLLGGRLHQARMLLIVDDAWAAVHVQPFLSSGPGCATLVTTRTPEVATDVEGLLYPLRILSDEAAFELFAELASGIAEESPQEVRVLVHELEGLPLAIRVAARLLVTEHHTGLGAGALLEELREGSQLLRAKAPADRSDLAMGTTPTVAALLERSTDRLTPVELHRFALLGGFASRPATFDVAAIAAQWRTADPGEHIRVLIARGLLEPDGRGRFQMHALLTHHARLILRGQ